jgi:hypothetical protein
MPPDTSLSSFLWFLAGQPENTEVTDTGGCRRFDFAEYFCVFWFFACCSLDSGKNDLRMDTAYENRR